MCLFIGYNSDFENVRDEFYNIFPLSEQAKNGQLLMLKAITGYATGLALAQNRKLLEASDLISAKANTCQEWPKCRDMLSSKLFDFDKNYKEYLSTFYFQK